MICTRRLVHVGVREKPAMTAKASIPAPMPSQEPVNISIHNEEERSASRTGVAVMMRPTRKSGKLSITHDVIGDALSTLTPPASRQLKFHWSGRPLDVRPENRRKELSFQSNDFTICHWTNNVEQAACLIGRLKNYANQTSFTTPQSQ